MARISGIELNDKWTANYALTRIKGIGWKSSTEILSALKIEKGKRLGDLSRDDLTKVANKLDDYLTEGDLIRQTRENVKRLKIIGAYRGIRHDRGLPSRGQRTKSNARTKRGSRKTVGSFRKEMLSKTPAAK